MREVSYAIRATRIEDGQTKFWCDYNNDPFWWSSDASKAAKYTTVSEAHSEIRFKLSNIRTNDGFCLDIVPVQS